MSDYPAIRKALESMRKDFNQRIDVIEAKVEESEKRISDHDNKFVSLEESVRDIRKTAHKTTAELHRLADGLTTQGLSLEMIKKNTKLTLDLLQKKVVL